MALALDGSANLFPIVSCSKTDWFLSGLSMTQTLVEGRSSAAVRGRFNRNEKKQWGKAQDILLNKSAELKTKQMDVRLV